MSSADESTQGTEVSKSNRAGKGKVYLEKLSIQRAKGIKTDVNFNERGQPIGQAGSELQSYIGVLARQHIKVSYHEWRDVPDEAKETIWASVKLVFTLPEHWKKNCLTSANTKWRQWKSKLYRRYIVPHEDHPDLLFHPPPLEGIRDDDWKDFVISRISEIAKKKSQDLKELRAKNVYPHRLSRKGYAGLREEMLQKKQLTGNEEIDRALLWKRARANREGEFEGELMVDAAAKIDEYIQQKKTEGTFSGTDITDDILSQALGKPENSGRLKGVGGYVTPSIYLKIHSESVKDRDLAMMKQDLAAMKERIDQMINWQEEMRNRGALHEEAAMKERMDQMISWQEEMINRGALQEETGSCSVMNDVVSLVNDEVEHVLLKMDKLKKRASPKKSVKLNAEDIPTSLKLLHVAAKHVIGDDGTIRIPVNEDVFGQKEKIVYILFDDIHQFCELNSIGAGSISVYILHLYKVSVNADLIHKIRFVDPYAVSHNPNVAEKAKIMGEKANIVGRRLIGTSQNQLLFVPCNVGYHWILLVVDAHGEKVYVLDPLQNSRHFADWRKITKMAIKIFNASIGKRGRIHTHWEVVKCPQQSDANQCGFYVMRYMKDIIDGIRESLPLTDMFNEEMYLRREIDEVRIEWCDILQNYMN